MPDAPDAPDVPDPPNDVAGDSAPGAPAGAPETSSDLPEAAGRRFASGAFSSGLTVPDFAACLQMGLEPVALVQGFCVMQWSWYGQSSPFMRGPYPYAARGGYAETWRCPHGFVSADHRAWGQNYEQPWVEQAWAQGFSTAYGRLVEEARALGAHGVIGVVDTTRHLSDMSVTEFHILGTAVVVQGAPPADGRIFTTYLAGQRLAKLIEAGFMPVSVAAALASVRVWAYCMTEYLMEGRAMYGRGYGAFAGPPRTVQQGSNGWQEIEQVARAHMAAWSIAREHVRGQLGSDSLQGASLASERHELSEGDEVVECALRGNRIRRFKAFDPLPTPRPTVRLT